MITIVPCFPHPMPMNHTHRSGDTIEVAGWQMAICFLIAVIICERRKLLKLCKKLFKEKL